MTSLDLIAPGGTGLDRLVVIGTGKLSDLKENDWLRLGGAAMGALGKAKAATVLLERPDGRKLARRGGRLRPRHEAPRLQLRQIQEAEKTRTTIARQPVDVTIALAEPADGAERLVVAVRGRRRHASRARSRQRAGQYSRSRRVRRAGGRAVDARRRSRGARRQGAEEARHGRASRRGAGLGPPAARRRHALERAARPRSSRSPSSARASSSTPAASRSSPPPAWRT